MAHSPETDGQWPPAAVTATIERLASDEMENAIVTGRFNMSGRVSCSRKSRNNGTPTRISPRDDNVLRACCRPPSSSSPPGSVQLLQPQNANSQTNLVEARLFVVAKIEVHVVLGACRRAQPAKTASVRRS